MQPRGPKLPAPRLPVRRSTQLGRSGAAPPQEVAPESEPALEPRTPFPPVARGGERSGDRPPDEERLLDPGLPLAELEKLSAFAAARHLMVRLAQRRGQLPRDALLTEVGELVLALPPALARKTLLELPGAGRIVDIYPLEVLAYVLERRPEVLPEFSFDPFVLERGKLEAREHPAGETIRVSLPLQVKVRAFALEGGGAPGYWLAPGMPGEYLLELYEPGRYRLLLRGDVRKRALLDRLTLLVGPGPETEEDRV